MILVAFAALNLACGSCNQQTVIGEDPGTDSNERKNMKLSTSSAEFLQKGNETFSFEFIDRVNSSVQEDYMISPLSLQFLLGMILDGAQGQTAAEICQVLGFGAGEQEAVNLYSQEMLSQLPNLDRLTSLNIANAIFVKQDRPLKEAFRTAMAQYYDAEVSNLDFNDPGSVDIINKWCSDHTNGMIPKILNEVSPEMLAYLLNAIYFKSQWKDKFDARFTREETFTDEAGKTHKLPMMKQERKYPYTENETFQAVCLPYGNGAFSMTVILPRQGKKVADAVAALKGNGWAECSKRMYRETVDLWLPRFETKFHIKLNDILSEMGMPLAFDKDKAEFKAMSDFALALSFVQQDAAIKVDEEGTEAAVISSAGMMETTAIAPGQTFIFHADHPFLYLITEKSTGAILFAGRYSNIKK